MIPLIAAALRLGLTATTLAAASPPARVPFALVELYTSEGCSSCPPADRLLSQLDREAAQSGRNLLTLEFHVDYWNSAAWRDAFSSGAHSERQRQYAAALGSEVYTPQAVINGRTECVGSDAGRVHRAVDAALASAPHVALAIESVTDGGHPAVHYRLSGAEPNARVCAALAESGIVTRVGGGENAGREVAHGSVVREFLTRARGQADSGELRFSAAATSEHPRRIVVFVQDPKTLAILAAASVAI
ncbi:MAG: DUF1223 domain-containing protein [Candidatus Eiseniibacteriota bacterium]